MYRKINSLPEIFMLCSENKKRCNLRVSVKIMSCKAKLFQPKFLAVKKM